MWLICGLINRQNPTQTFIDVPVNTGGGYVAFGRESVVLHFCIQHAVVTTGLIEEGGDGGNLSS